VGAPAGGDAPGAAAPVVLLREYTVSTTKPMPTSTITMPTMIANSATFSAN